MNEPTVLVTGGAGYIGSHACKRLLGAGYLPVTYDNLSNGKEWLVRWGPLEQGDILDREKLEAVLHRYQPIAIMHFAALAYVGESMIYPAKYYLNNMQGTVSLLDAMQRQGVSKLIFSSTCATYGVPKQIPINEDHIQAPINPYGRSKLVIEKILHDYSVAYDLRACALRYFNAAGADPDGEIGEVHEPEPHLIPNVLKAAAGEIDHVMIHGDDYETTDGTCIRDYIHVDDLATAHVIALQQLGNDPNWQVFNLGIGRGYSVKEIIDAAQRVMDRPIPTKVGPRREGDPPVLIADPSRANKVLGWKPRYSDIETIVQTAWNWEQKQGEVKAQVKLSSQA